MSEIDFELLRPELTRIISKRVSWIVRLLGLPSEDVRDLPQELFGELWIKRLAYDPHRGSWRTFSESVVRNKLASLMRHQHARCRRRTIEVDADCLADSLPAPDGRIELGMDVRKVLAILPEFDRNVGLALAEYSAAETSVLLDVSRASIYRSIGRLRAAFFDAGLRGSNTYARKHLGEACRSEVPA